MYLKKVREGGGVVSAGIAMAAAKGILLTCNQTMLTDWMASYIEPALGILSASAYEVCQKEGHFGKK